MERSPVLVLNANFEPIHVCSTHRAISLILTGKADLVMNGRGEIHTVSRSYPRPTIIRLEHMVHRPRQRVKLTKREILRRDSYTCQYCGAQPGSEELTIDHVLPRSRGGVSSWENCVLACMACNKRKADRTPEQARMRVRKQPVRPTWRPLYADHTMRIASWSKFVSEAYWNVELQK